MLKFLAAIGLACVLNISLAQEYAFREFSLKQGLPQSQVKTINQDADGFLWVGTLGGLARFDGKNFDVYTVENGLLSNRITCIEFIAGVMYVGHENGLSIHLGKDKFRSISTTKLKDNTKLSSIIQVQGRILVASNGSGLFELKNDKLLPINPNIEDEELADEFNRIRQLCVWKKQLYIGTRSGLFTSSDLKVFKHFDETEDWSISDLIVDKQGQLYVCTFNEGVLKIDLNNTRFQPQSFLDVDGSQMHLDAENNFWLLTETNEILMISNQSKFFLSQQSGLPKESMSTFFIDQNSNLWLGTEGRGMIQFLGRAFTKYAHIEAPVLSITTDHLGRFWLGTLNNGLFIWEQGVWKRYEHEQLRDNSVWCALKDGFNGIWFGTNAGLLSIQNGKPIWHTIANNTELPDNKINTLHLDANKFIWIGTRKGLAYVKSNLIHRFEPANNAEMLHLIRDIESKNHQLYVATKTALVLVDIHSRKVNSYAIEGVNPTFSCLEFDHNNNLWIGTEEGLFVLIDNKIQALDFSKKSADRFINFIIRKGEKMFVGTNNGLFEMSNLTQDLSSFETRHFAESSGLMSTETNINSAFFDKQNQLWFGTADGVYVFNENQLNQALEDYRPQLFLRDFQVNFVSTELPDKGSKIKLKYNQNRLRYFFQVVDLHDAEGVSLEYKLDNDEWVAVGSSSEIAFNQLAPGTYNLSVRAKSITGKYSDVLIFNFDINRPYYATWWFFLLILLGLGLITIGIVRYRIQQIRMHETRERLELNNKLNTLEQQSLNASMNRHFIFNALNSIQYFINTQDKLSANKYLTKFAQLIRKNLDSSAAGENLVPLSEEIQRLELYLTLESMRFEDRFSYRFEMDPEIEADDVRIPPMLFQPFVENAIIHGILPRENYRGEIVFKAELQDTHIEFSISDNGVGFSNSMREKKSSGDHFSHGTTITKSRIEVIRKISGDIIELDGPKDLLNDAHQVIGTIVKIKIRS